MNIDDIKQFANKRVRIITSTRFTYIGRIEGYGTNFIRIRDKYDKLVMISLEFIQFIEEVSE